MVWEAVCLKRPYSVGPRAIVATTAASIKICVIPKLKGYSTKDFCNTKWKNKKDCHRGGPELVIQQSQHEVQQICLNDKRNLGRAGGPIGAVAEHLYPILLMRDRETRKTPRDGKVVRQLSGIGPKPL